MANVRSVGFEKWLFYRGAIIPWLAVGGFLFGCVEVVAVAAGDIWPQSHFAAVELSNVMFLFLVPGSAAAFGTFALMVVYLARYDPTPHCERRRWIKWFVIGGTFTACIYCLTVYRGQVLGRERGAMPRRPWRTA